MLGRKRIKELETEVANLIEIIAGKDSKIERLERDAKTNQLMLANKNTEFNRLRSDLILHGVWPSFNVDIENALELSKIKAENEKLKNTKWHKEYQKVMRKLEKITDKNKPF